jgi:beta-glucosidase
VDPVNRDPRWGRNIESFGEDPALIAALGASYIHGIQRGRPDAVDSKSAASGYLKIMAVPKHLGAYSVECFNPTGGPNDYPHCPVYRSNFNSVLDEMDLRETYFPGWRAAVDPGPKGANAQVDAIPHSAQSDLIRTSFRLHLD